MALGIKIQQPSGIGKRAVIANAGKNVQHFPAMRRRVTHAVRGQQRQIQFSRDDYRRLIPRFFHAAEMPLQFHVNILTPKNAAKLLHAFSPAFNSSVNQRVFQRPLVSSR